MSIPANTLPYGIWYDAKVIDAEVLKSPSTHSGDSSFIQGHRVYVIRRHVPKGTKTYGGDGVFAVRIGVQRANLALADATKALEILGEHPDQDFLNASKSIKGAAVNKDSYSERKASASAIRKVLSAYEHSERIAAPAGGIRSIADGIEKGLEAILSEYAQLVEHQVEGTKDFSKVDVYSAYEGRFSFKYSKGIGTVNAKLNVKDWSLDVRWKGSRPHDSFSLSFTIDPTAGVVETAAKIDKAGKGVFDKWLDKR
jgi:hypothetical protein